MSNVTPDFDLEVDEAIAAGAPAKDTAPAPKTPEELPEKFRGKSVFDIIDMYHNAERKISEQGAQLGELRSLSDELLGLKKKENVKEKVKVTTEDLLTDPDQALNKVLDNSSVADKVTATESRLDALEKSFGQKEFEGRHPDFIKDVQDPAFQNWVRNNRARSQLLVELDQNHNFDAGTALWDMWSEHKELTSKLTPQAKKDNIRDASTVRNTPSEGARKPVYSRAKLLELQTKAIQGDRAARAKWEDPMFQKEYQEAYAEGRVK